MKSCHLYTTSHKSSAWSDLLLDLITIQLIFRANAMNSIGVIAKSILFFGLDHKTNQFTVFTINEDLAVFYEWELPFEDENSTVQQMLTGQSPKSQGTSFDNHKLSAFQILSPITFKLSMLFFATKL